jgi:exosortase
MPQLSAESNEPVYLGIRASSWARGAVIAGLFAAVFWPNLRRLWQKTNPFTGEANWGHAVCVPIIGIYYLYVHRDELAEAGIRPFIWDRVMRPGRLIAALAMVVSAAVLVLGAGKLIGRAHLTMRDITVSAAEAVGVLGVLVLLLDWSLATTIFGLGLYVYGIYPGQNDYLKDCGMVVTLYGIVLLTCGRPIMRLAWFPIVFLMCAIPWPGLVYSWIAGPLQELAANAAVMVLKATGVDAITSGTKIVIYGTTLANTRMLNVAEACAGMRSLMTFIAVAAAVAFLSPRPLWQRIIITVSAVPIAIFCNVMRVSGQGLLDHYVSTKLSESFAHQFVGMIMLVPAFFLILGVGWLLDRIFIEEADHEELPAVVTVSTPPAVVAPQAVPGAPAVQIVPAVAREIPSPTSTAPPAKAIAPPAPAVVSPPVVRPPPRATAARATPPSSVTPRLPAQRPAASPPAAGKAPPAKPLTMTPPPPVGAPMQQRVAAIAARTSKIPPLAEQQIALRLPPRPRTALNLSATTPPAVGRPLGPLRKPLPPEVQSASAPMQDAPAAPSQSGAAPRSATDDAPPAPVDPSKPPTSRETL